MENLMIKLSASAIAGAVLAVAATLAGQASAQEQPQLVARDEQGNLRQADDAAGFGAKGQWAFSTDAALTFERRTQDGTAAVTTLSILPAADYFIIENLSVGAVIGVRYQKQGDFKSTSFQLGPRVGYNIELSPLLSLWPKLGFAYAHNRTKNDVGDDGEGSDLTVETTNNAIAMNVFVPVMLHPAPHFFAGFGPFVDTDLNGDNRATTWGFRLTLGGWL
jgi:opacity protein-like surface antigen